MNNFQAANRYIHKIDDAKLRLLHIAVTWSIDQTCRG